MKVFKKALCFKIMSLCILLTGSVVNTGAVTSQVTFKQVTKQSSNVGNTKQNDNTISTDSHSITSHNAEHAKTSAIERAAYGSKSVTSLPDITQASLSVIRHDSRIQDSGHQTVNTGQTSDNQHISTTVPKSIQSESAVIHSSADITPPTKLIISDGTKAVNEQTENKSGKPTSDEKIQDEIKNSESHVGENIVHASVVSEQNRPGLNRNNSVIKVSSQTTAESRGATTIQEGYTAITQPSTSQDVKNNEKTRNPETLHNSAGGVPAIMSSSLTSVLVQNTSTGAEMHHTSDKPVSLITSSNIRRVYDISNNNNNNAAAAALQALSEMIRTTIVFSEPSYNSSQNNPSKTHSTAKLSDPQMQFRKSNQITGSTSPALENTPSGHILVSSNLMENTGNITDRPHTKDPVQPMLVTASEREQSTTVSPLVHAPVLRPIINNNNSTIIANKSAIHNNSDSHSALLPPYTANLNTDSLHTANVSKEQAPISSNITGSPLLIDRVNDNSASAMLEPEESLHRIGYKLFNETVPPELSKYPKNITDITGKPTSTQNIVIPIVHVVNIPNDTDIGARSNESDATLPVHNHKLLAAPPILVTNESEIINGTITTEQSLKQELRNQSVGDKLTTIATSNVSAEKVDFIVPVLSDVSNVTNSTADTTITPLLSGITNTTTPSMQNTTISVLVPVLSGGDNITKTLNETEAIVVTVLPDSSNITKSGENITDIVLKPLLIPSEDNSTESSYNVTEAVVIVITPVLDVSNTTTTPDVVNGSTGLNKTVIVPSTIAWWSSSSSVSPSSHSSSPPPLSSSSSSSSSTPPLSSSAGNISTIPPLIASNATAEVTSVPKPLSTAALTVIITGSIVAFWIILGPLICLICKIRDKYKHGPPGNWHTNANLERGVMDKIIMTEMKRVKQTKNNESNEDNNDVDNKGVNEENDDLVNVTLEDTMLTEKQNIYNEKEVKDRCEIMPLNR